MKTKREELAEIRDMVDRVAGGFGCGTLTGADREADHKVYAMFGSLSAAEAHGLSIGLTFALHNLQEG